MAEDEVHLPGMDPEGEYEDEYLGEDAAALLGIHHMEEDPIEVDVGTGSTDPATIASNDPPSVGVAAAPSLTPSSAGTGKRKSIVWDFFDEIVVDGVVKAKCRMCSGILSAVSAYLMLQHLCEEPYPGVFKTFINANFGSEDLLTTRHFTIAKQILQFLEVFYESTVILSGVYYPTSPLVMHQLLEIAIHLQAADEDINLYTIVYPMKQKYLKYWKQIPMLFSIAFVLDPRAKMIGLYNTLTLLKDFAGCEYSSYYADVRSELEKLFAKYEKKYGTARVVREQPPSIIGKRKNATWDRIFGGAGSVVQPGVVCNSAMSELSSYLDSDRLTEYDDSFDILLWWKDHKLTFPVLSILARDVLSVPASTVSSESCFSLTGRILEERRRRLLPEHVEMLVCIKDWELGDAREQHSLVTEHKELAERFDKISIVDGAQGTTADAGGVPAPAGVASQGATPSSVQGRGPGASAGRGGRGAAAAAGNRGGRGVAAAGRGQPAAGRGTAAGTGRGTAAARRGASAGVRASGLRGTRRG